MLKTTLTLVVPILALGLLYVVLPVAVGAYRRLRTRKVVLCPRSGRFAAIELDATQAALTAAVGKPDLQVYRCSRWPALHDCGQECLEQVDAESGDVHVT